MLAPETLFERIVNPVARARGGVYLSLNWHSKAVEALREDVLARFAEDGWLRVSVGTQTALLYRADDDVDLADLRRWTVLAPDGSHATLQQWCFAELRSAAPEVAFADRLRRSILAQLGDLLATQGVGMSAPLMEFPQVAASVLNFGVELPIGATASQDALRQFEDAVALAIRRFEPRLNPETLTVRTIEPEIALARGVLQMQVMAELRPAYGAGNVRFHTSIDLQTGRATASEEAAHA